MATPKKYPQFPAGTYDTSKIFLQADPVTGALEKVNLPGTSSQQFKRLSQIVTVANNVGSLTQDAFSFSIPANTLKTPGDQIQVTSRLQRLTTNSTTLALILGGTTILSTIQSATSASILQATITMIDTSHVQYDSVFISNGVVTSTGNVNNLSLNTTIANIIKTTMKGTASDQITAYFQIVNLMAI